jgi:hypothetical protein
LPCEKQEGKHRERDAIHGASVAVAAGARKRK